MKTIKIILALAYCVVFGGLVAGAANASGFDLPPQETAASIAAVSFLSVFFVSAPKGSLLTGIVIADVANEFRKMIGKQNVLQYIRQFIYYKAQLAGYTKALTRVKGSFPAAHSITGRLVQQYSTTWAPMGETSFKVNELKAYHQKVNLPFTPGKANGTWLAYLAEENKTPAETSLAMYMMNTEVGPAIVRDIDWLMCNGVYDAAQPSTFGYSMNGVTKILQDGVANTTNPMYKVPLAAITDSNAVEVVTQFEREIPKSIADRIDKIYMSAADKERYIIDYENRYGTLTYATADSRTRTRLGRREIVGLNQLDASLIFATPNENFIRLIDIVDAPPALTDVQVADYDVKLFFEWHLGIGFWINQLVVTSVNIGSGSGLATDNNLYYA